MPDTFFIDDETLLEADWHNAVNNLVYHGVFPSGVLVGVREKLTANRTYYVRTDGNDSNNGFANTAGGAFATIQKAFDVACTIDASVYDVTVKLGNSGTFAGAILKSPMLGVGRLTLQGDTATPENTKVYGSGSGACGIQVSNGTLHIDSFEIASEAQSAIRAIGRGVVFLVTNVHFGASGHAHLDAREGGYIHNDYNAGAYWIKGGASFHIFAAMAGVLSLRAIPVTLSITPHFVTCFAYSEGVSAVMMDNISWFGSATGTKFLVGTNAVLATGGGGASYFPGSVAGGAYSGGVYS